MNDREEVEALIRTHGGVLVRSRKHRVYRFPDGRCFTLSSTPGDSVHAELNNLTDLRHFLGIKREIHKNPNRRSKQGRKAVRPRYIAPIAPAPLTDWKRKLSGLLITPRFRPRPCRTAVHLETLPRTPLFAILLHLFPIREKGAA